ncbi:MAG: H/ACA ribonucleoprotein complex subunit NOP10 [Promethearchaeota archaeon]
MPKMLYYCDSCKSYTMEEKICPKCGEQLRTPHPPKFSPHDKYQKYRISYFKEKLNKIYDKNLNSNEIQKQNEN